ncbi:MAG: translocation/assembly module TamB domain-containing protein, partial [Prevotella sp.]
MGFANRLIIDDIHVLDQKGKQMLKVSRVSVKIDLWALAKHRISITSSQFFGLKADLYKANAHSDTNFQFVIDSLSSKDKTKTSSDLDLQINSLIIRHGAVRYRQLDVPIRNHAFSLKNIDTENISGHFILDKLTNDSINLKIKKLSFFEKSGIKVNNLTFKIHADKRKFALNDFLLEMPNSKLRIDKATATYDYESGRPNTSTISYNGEISDSHVTVSDLAFLSPCLKNINNRVNIASSFSGTADKVDINRFEINETNGMLHVITNVSLEKSPRGWAWSVDVPLLVTNYDGVKQITDNIQNQKLPETLMHLGKIEFSGKGHGYDDTLDADGLLRTDIGDVKMTVNKRGQTINGNIDAPNIHLQQLTANTDLGDIGIHTNISSQPSSGISIDGNITHIDYGKYTYRDILFKGSYNNKVIVANVNINDPNARIDATGHIDMSSATTLSDIHIFSDNISPNNLRLTDKYEDTIFGFDITANIFGNKPSDIYGKLALTDFTMKSDVTDYRIDSLIIDAQKTGDNRDISIVSDFAKANIYGKMDLLNLKGSISYILNNALPSISGFTPRQSAGNNRFAINATIYDTKWLNLLFDIPVTLNHPAHINGSIDDTEKNLSMTCDIPEFSYNDSNYDNASLSIQSIDDAINADARIKINNGNGKKFTWAVKTKASDDNLKTTILINDDVRHPIRGTINTNTQFVKVNDRISTAIIDVEESTLHIGDSIWHIRPSNITYSKNNLVISNFAITHDNQHLSINGKATNEQSDSVLVDFKDLDVKYILDMVNFHSVEFSGLATGHAFVSGIFSKKPQAEADLTVNDFKFQDGRMGVLYANAQYDADAGSIDINATANDGPDRRTIINGYVSPKQNSIDLDIEAHNTRIEFMESFCSSFMKDVNAHANGSVKLSGPLNSINLTGRLVADGNLTLSSLNTTYALRNDTIRFIPDEIIFANDTIYDKYGNTGIIEGNIHHQHLTHLSYDLNIDMNNMLAYNTNAGMSDSFYGTVYANGNCTIKGRSGEVIMDINATPCKNSIITYYVNSLSSADNHEFIQWKQQRLNQSDENGEFAQSKDDKVQFSSDLRMNFLVNTTPDLTIKIIMDNITGDYITLNGDGTLRATYFNKGTLDIYGNYIVDHGLYRITIRDFIKKDFSFERGSLIKFGGAPFSADLDLKAQYILNSVNLSDLNIGNSFTNNNIRVNCLMNITGTPDDPKVTFGLDMPTLSSDAKQMISSILNAEEEMNQQVLYLLAVGRFYTQGNNNANTSSQQSQ